MIRMVGAGCIALGSGAFGFAMAAASRREEEQLRLLVRVLERVIPTLSRCSYTFLLVSTSALAYLQSLT